MSKEIPEFQRSVGITPSGGGLAGFQKAVKPGVLADVSLGTIASNVAQNAANQQAVLSGTKAYGEGYKPIPAFNETDEQFNKAFQVEEVANVSNQASKFLNDSYLEVAKNPSMAALNTFAKEAEQGLLELVETASPLSRAQLSRDLLSAYQSSYNKLSGVVANRERQDAIDNYYVQSKQDDNLIYNELIEGQGHSEIAENKYTQKLNSIDAALANHWITNKEAYQQKEEAKVVLWTGKYTGELYKAINEGKGAEFLANWAQNPPDFLKPNQVEEIGVELYKRYNQINALKSAQQNINYTDVQAKMLSGELSYQDALTANISPQQAANLRLDYAKLQAKELKEQEEFREIVTNSDNVMFMSGKTNQEVAKNFDKYVKYHEQVMAQNLGQDTYQATILDKAQLAQNWKAPITPVIKQAEVMVQAGTPEQAMQASQAIRKLFNNNPLAINGIDGKVLAAALDITDNANISNLPDDISVERVRNNIYGEEAKNNEVRASDYDKTLSKVTNGVPMETYLAANLKSLLGVSSEVPMPAAVLNQFSKAVKDNYVQNKATFANAMEMAAVEIGQTGGETDVSGFKQWMYASPEKYVAEGNSVGVRNKMLLEVDGFINDSKAAYDKDKLAYYYESVSLNHQSNHAKNNPEKFNLYDKNLIEGAVKVDKVFRNGERVAGILYFDSDRFTTANTRGIPNYIAKFKSNNFIESMVIPQYNRQDLRIYLPVINEAAIYSQEQNEKYIKEVIESKVKHNVIRRAQQNRMESYGFN